LCTCVEGLKFSAAKMQKSFSFYKLIFFCGKASRCGRKSRHSQHKGTVMLGRIPFCCAVLRAERARGLRVNSWGGYAGGRGVFPRARGGKILGGSHTLWHPGRGYKI
jgi:hypothetical protein